jgi:RimJ/RimL family protein N-acetyltransferase
MTIRPIEIRDLPELFDLRAATRENPFSREALQKLGITEKTTARAMETTLRGWLSESGHVKCGFAMGDGSTGEMSVIAVLPQYEGQGIGGALLSAVESWLFSLNWRELWLWTSSNPASRAFSFYTKRGWVVTENKGEVVYMRKFASDRSTVRAPQRESLQGVKESMRRFEGLAIRGVESSDLEKFYAHQLDPVANKMAAFVCDDPKDKVAFDAHWDKILNSSLITKRTIVAGGRVAGYISCYPRGDNLEVTYWLGREFWGRGLATEALACMLRLVRDRPIFARAATDNVGSIRVLQKCGFNIIDKNRDYANARGEDTEEYILRLDHNQQLNEAKQSGGACEPAVYES